MGSFHRHEVDPRPKWLRWFLLKSVVSATGPWWDRRTEQLIHRAPIRYYLQHDVPMWFRRQAQVWRDRKYWIIHRTTDKYHVVPTGLKPGYHDAGERMLYASFELLRQYVEITQASSNYNSDLPKTDARARGLEYLQWQIDDPQCAGHQADTAKIVKDLYLWWVDERPKRTDPYDCEGIWGKKDDTENTKRLSWRERRKARRLRRRMFSDDSKDRRLAGARSHALTTFYDAQDSGMLTKLVSVRLSLWA